MTEERKDWIKWEMELYDRLTPEMRAVVQEYGDLPWDPTMPAEEFREHQEQIRKVEQEWLLETLWR